MKVSRPTILDLEKATGYSTGTISRAFNQSSEISTRTRALILRKADEIGYVPHSGARSARGGRTGRWGLLLPHLRNPRYSEIMDQLDLEANRRSTLLLLGLSRYDAAIETRLALHWASGETDGIIADSCIDATVFKKLWERRFPLVFLFGRPSVQFNMVKTSVRASQEMLVNRLVALGHRRIGYVGHEADHCRTNESFLTYHAVLQQHGLPLQDDLLFFGEHSYTAGREAWEHWRGKSRPTAVVCRHDDIACQLVTAAQADGFRVPDDLSIVGSDDIPEAKLCNLTTMRLDPAVLARQAVELLGGDQEKFGHVRVVEATVVERGSVAAPRP